MLFILNGRGLKLEGLFEKFDQVTIDNSSKISITDREYCIKQYTEFAAAIQFCLDHITFLNNNALGDNEFLNTEDLIKKSEKYLAEITKSFITNIFYYFSSTYNVTLNSALAVEKFDHNVTWQNLVDEIIEQLGGRSFTEKASQEIKDKLHKTVGCGEVKGTRLILNNFLYYSDGFGGDAFLSGQDDLYKLLIAISHYEGGWTELKSHIFRQLTGSSYIRMDFLFREHDLSWHNKVKAIKFYKNRKVEIKFASSEFCELFAREYCGILKKAV